MTDIIDEKKVSKKAMLSGGTNNAVNAPFPLSATQGGLGVASPTAHGILVGEGSSAVTPIVLSAGQILIGTTSSDPSAATITGGANISVTSTTGSIVIASTVGSWVDQTSTSVTMAVNTNYVADNVALVTLTLPSTAAFGSQFTVAGKGSGGWKIAQAASQQINFGNVVTTSGTGGSLASANAFDVVSLVCTTANTGFSVISSIGNITYV
jgi:hypothetical protein